MRKNNQEKDEVRHEAEKKLDHQENPIQPVKDLLHHIHELHENQFELNKKNEQLKQAQAEAEEAYRQYTDLYDFAPVGYFTLARDGTIRKVNLSGADLLGVGHTKLVDQKLGSFVADASLPVFNNFFETLLSATGRKTCELQLQRGDGDSRWVWAKASCFEGGMECRVMLLDSSERKQMEKELLHSEMRAKKNAALLRSVMESPQGMVIFALDTNFCYTAFTVTHKKIMNTLWGVDIEPGMNILEVIGDTFDRKKARENFERVLRGEQFILTEEYGDATKHRIWYENRYNPIIEETGVISGMTVFVTDITERKRAEQVLQSRLRLSQFADLHQLDELLQLALDEAEALTTSKIGFAHFLDADQKTLHLQMWSTNTLTNMCTAAGKDSHYPVEQAGVWAECVYTRTPVIHNDYASLAHRKGLPQGHAPILREIIVPVLRNNVIVMIMGVGNKPDNYDENDVETLSQLASLAWDIIQRKQAEDALKTSEKKYRLLHESMIDGFGSVDLSGRLQDCNQAYRDMLGYSEAEIAQLTYFDITPEKWHAIEADIVENQILQRGYSDVYEKEYIRKSGEVFPVELHAVLLRGEDGKPAGMWAIVRDITERKYNELALERANLELQTALAREQELSRTDSLTGVNNRRHLYKLAEHEFHVAARYQHPLSVVMFDIDHFKRVNDTFGHEAGDQILKLVTDTARSELRSTDLIGRYGGEEFIILLPMTNAEQAWKLAERIRMNVEALSIQTDKGNASVTLSIGIVDTIHISPINSVEDVFRRADEAMYAAKQTGRNRIVVLE